MTHMAQQCDRRVMDGVGGGRLKVFRGQLEAIGLNVDASWPGALCVI
jgi:hypothetical protein